MSKVPKVSVLIPAYNYGYLLDETIQSVLDQTYTDYELIIVDNCSNDNTVEVVQKYLSDNRISFYRNETNIGLSGNWNRCLELAKGTYIKFLCADDKFHPSLLEKYVAVMDANPSVSIVTCNKQEFTNTKIIDKVCILPFEGIVNGNDVIKQIITNDRNIIGSPTRVMFRSKNLPTASFGDYKFITDLEMWIRHLCVGNCFFYTEILAYGRVHEGQQQVISKKYSEDRIEYYRLYKNLSKGIYKIDNKINNNRLLKNSVKRMAIKCTYCFYKHLPKISSPRYRKSTYNLFKIAINEKVIFSPYIFQFFRKGLDKNKNTHNYTQAFEA